MYYESVDRSILLDELDLGIEPNAGIVAVREAVVEFLEHTFRPGHTERTYRNLYAVSVERLAVSEIDTRYQTGLWIEEGGNFMETMQRVVSRCGIPEECAEHSVRTGDHIPALNQLKRQLREAFSQKDYDQIGRLANLLAGCQHSGLPGVKHGSSSDFCKWRDICDLRLANYGPGTRLLVEFAVS